MAGLNDAAFLRIMEIIKSPDHCDVALSNGQSAMVDVEDFEIVSPYKWYIRDGYATARINGKAVLMHRLLLSAPTNREVDHINGNGLDNRRGNIRLCTKQENSRNRRVVTGKSRFKGVLRDRGMWRAQIKVDGTAIHIGVFDTERLAARAYDKEARRRFGSFACTNEDLELY